MVTLGQGDLLWPCKEPKDQPIMRSEYQAFKDDTRIQDPPHGCGEAPFPLLALTESSAFRVAGKRGHHQRPRPPRQTGGQSIAVALASAWRDVEDSGPLQDFRVLDPVWQAQRQSSVEAAEMELIQFPIFPRVAEESRCLVKTTSLSIFRLVFREGVSGYKFSKLTFLGQTDFTESNDSYIVADEIAGTHVEVSVRSAEDTKDSHHQRYRHDAKLLPLYHVKT
ncbi:unnamed protein product [Schistocephalus solidus]|uniref:Cystatin domain-containing protein n=1 Tax=Schistocephalus solidus TaxID=70667 RepID=A0A183SR76_SCHSO|nr:unnamed protein product [Schistocephalus solidus]